MQGHAIQDLGIGNAQLFCFYMGFFLFIFQFGILCYEVVDEDGEFSLVKKQNTCDEG